MTTDITKAAAALGRKGGQARTEAKQAASRNNGKGGGRPRRTPMTATITYADVTTEQLTGRNISDIRSQLNSRLRVDGPRALTAITDSGTEIHVELYDGQDYVRTALGRELYQ